MKMHPVYKLLKIGCGVQLRHPVSPTTCGTNDLCSKCMKKLFQLHDLNNDMALAIYELENTFEADDIAEDHNKAMMRIDLLGDELRNLRDDV